MFSFISYLAAQPLLFGSVIRRSLRNDELRSQRRIEHKCLGAEQRGKGVNWKAKFTSANLILRSTIQLQQKKGLLVCAERRGKGSRGKAKEAGRPRQVHALTMHIDMFILVHKKHDQSDPFILRKTTLFHAPVATAKKPCSARRPADVFIVLPFLPCVTMEFFLPFLSPYGVVSRPLFVLIPCVAMLRSAFQSF